MSDSLPTLGRRSLLAALVALSPVWTAAKGEKEAATVELPSAAGPVAPIPTLAPSAIAPEPSAPEAAAAPASAAAAAAEPASASKSEGALGALQTTAGGVERAAKSGEAPDAALQAAFDEAAPARAELDPQGVLSWAPAQSLTARETAASGLQRTYDRLQKLAETRYGLTPRLRAGLLGSRALVSERTPIKTPEPGRPGWLPNRDFRSNVQRSFAITLGPGSIAKFKGSGADRRGRLGSGAWVEVPFKVNAAPFSRGMAYTWRILFGLPYTDGRSELVNLLQAHELFQRAMERPAPFPIPVDLRRVDTVTIDGRSVSVLRAWADPRYWPQPLEQWGHMRSMEELAEGALGESAFAEMRAGWELGSAEAKARWLSGKGIEVGGLPERTINTAYESYRLAEVLLERDPLTQLVVLERASVRNVIPTRNPMAEIFGGASPLDLDAWESSVKALAASYGQDVQTAPAAASRRELIVDLNRKALDATFLSACEEAGDAFGFFAGVGAKLGQSLGRKDMIGGQPTDFLDMGIPDARQRDFNAVGKEDFWLPDMREPTGLFDFLYTGSGRPSVRAQGRRLFLDAARRSFRRSVESLLIGERA